MAITFEQYYAENFEKWVGLLTARIKDHDEAEDRVQDIFTRLIPRKEFCKDLIEKGEMDKYIQGTLGRQRAQIYREQRRQVPTVSIGEHNIDFLSSIKRQSPSVALGGFCPMSANSKISGGIELNDFYDGAVKLLEDTRKITSDCGFETVGELRQYIFVQYARNGQTLQEIGEVVGLSHQNISVHYKRIVTILMPTIEAFIEKK